MVVVQYIFYSGLTVCMNLSVALAAHRAARRLVRDDSNVSILIASLEIYFLYIVTVTAALGFSHLLYGPLVIAAGLAAYPLSRVIFSGPQKARASVNFSKPESFLESIFLWMIFSFTAFLFIYGLFTASIESDPMVYQLVFPVEWLHEHRLFIVDTPFGDPSRAYEPSNSSLYYLWLFVPWRLDFLAHFGQAPFLIVILLSVYGLASYFRFPRPWVYLPCVLVLLTPMTTRLSLSALTDMSLAAHVLAALYFVTRFDSGRQRSLLYMFFISLALALGTKFIAAIYFFLLVASLAFLRRDAEKPSVPASDWLAFALILFIGGGFWYARNLAVTLNPVYPLQVELSKYLIFPGSFTRDAMLNWRWHVTGLENMREILAVAYLQVMLAAIILVYIFWIPALIAMRRLNRMEAYLLLLPVFWHIVNWHIIPNQMSRFWYPVLPLTYIGLMTIGRNRPRLIWAVIVIEILSLALRWKFPSPLTPEDYIWLYPHAAGIMLGIVFHVHHPGSIYRKIPGRRIVFGFIALVFLLSVAAPLYLQQRDRFFKGGDFEPVWEWIKQEPECLTVAWSGNSSRYPLYGPGMKNRPIAVAINEHRAWSYHDHDRYFKDTDITVDPNVSEAQIQRLEINPGKWIENLTAEGIDFLVVSKVSLYSLVTLVHDSEGWPIEKTWADAHPELFTRVLESLNFIAYRFNRDAAPRWSAEDLVTRYRPVDALEVYFDDPSESYKLFPNARLTIEKFDLKNLKREAR